MNNALQKCPVLKDKEKSENWKLEMNDNTSSFTTINATWDPELILKGGKRSWWENG